MANDLGATFYPGRDDYMMPELNIVSPAPQRFVPLFLSLLSPFQQPSFPLPASPLSSSYHPPFTLVYLVFIHSLFRPSAQFNFFANIAKSPTSLMPEVPVQIADSLEHLELEANNPRDRRNASHRGYHDTYATPPSSQGPGSRPISEDRHSSYHSSIADDYLSRFDSQIEEPSYSPFPRLINPCPNIPPSDEEKAMQIEGARMDVLSSNDPEMQLIWAQDALNYVEIAMNHYTRIADPPGRPQTPALEHQIKTDAINVVSFLADQRHPRAEFMRGNWLEFGKFGFRTDKKDAFRCYARAADKGFARAEYRMGMQFENSNEPQKAIQRYERGARAGDSASNYVGDPNILLMEDVNMSTAVGHDDTTRSARI